MSAGAFSKACPAGLAGRSIAQQTARGFFRRHARRLAGARPEVITRLIAERPEVFLLAMLKITQVHRVEFDRPDPPPSEEEALQRLERSAGRKARKMLEDFLAKVEKLERSDR